MHPVFSECPVCQGELIVTELDCRVCSTKIQGRFFAGPFGSLSLEQLDFVELFVRNQGKINRMESELGLSYPTIRNRLHEIIRALGYEPGIPDEKSLSDEERFRILEDLEKGTISYEDAMLMIKEREEHK